MKALRRVFNALAPRFTGDHVPGFAMFLACLVVAIIIHQAILMLVVRTNADAHLVAINKANASFKEYNLDTELCLKAPEAAGTGACSPDVKPVNEVSGIKWLMIYVREKRDGDQPAKWVAAPFAGEDRWFGVLSNPTLEHSVHSLSREVERAIQSSVSGDLPKDRATNLKLCAGTRKPLEDATCTKIALALKPVRDLLEIDFLWFRVIGLFFGFIQAITLAVFLNIVFSLSGLKKRLFFAKDHFFERDDHGDLQLKSGEAFQAAIDAYIAEPRRSALDRLFARLLIGLDNKQANADIMARLVPDAAESYREFQVEEPDSILSGLDVANEIMLKLAFAGTIWGIGGALFLARNLDALDPIENIITKSGMFAAIGTAFGTTLWGVILSIIASMMIHSFSREWTESVNRNYRFILDLGFDALFSHASLVPPEKRRQMGHRQLPLENQGLTGSIRALGLLGLLALAAVMLWTFRSELFELYTWVAEQ